MSGQEIGQIIIALLGGGGIATLVTKIASQRRLNKGQDVKNFQVLFNEIRKDINRLRDEQAEERKQWADERKEFNGKIDRLNERVRNQDKALHAKEIEVTELTGKVNLLQAQLNTYKDAHNPTKNVNIKA